MKYSTLLYSVLFVITANAQLNGIKLPSGDDEVKIRRLTHIISIYVTKKNQVFLENEPITLDQLSSKIDNTIKKMPIELTVGVRIFLNIDKKVKYKTVDKIKTELASIDRHIIVYKTNSLQEKDLLKGIYWRNHRSITKKYGIENEKIIFKPINKDEPPFVLPPPPPLHWSDDFYDALYNNDTIKIRKTLKDKRNKNVLLKNKGVLINGELVKFNDYENLYKKLTRCQLVIVRFDKNFKYKNYIKSIRLFKKIIHGRIQEKRGLYFYEISAELNELLNSNDEK